MAVINQAIILAAGLGQRLRSRAASKPLTRVHAACLLEISMRQLIAAGITKIVVVTGYQADQVEAEIDRLRALLPAEIVAARIDDWTRPNGWSVIAGAKQVEGPFVLVMADHIFADGLLDALAARVLAANMLEDCDAVLATDRIDNPRIDHDDVTWVALDQRGHIERIGKHIARFNAVDCGAFVATAGLPRAIATAIEQGLPGSLSDGMQVLARARRAASVDVAGAWWVDVDDPASLDLALREAPAQIGWLQAERASQSSGVLHAVG
ncbi:MAG: NTP transferase domain-containing protein [Pseudomonadota bacterium]